MRIWKWTLEITDIQTINLPVGSTILTAQMQHGKLQLWTMCKGGIVPTEPVTIAIYGTGHPLPDNFTGTYISTVQMYDGELVWHVFVLNR